MKWPSSNAPVWRKICNASSFVMPHFRSFRLGDGSSKWTNIFLASGAEFPMLARAEMGEDVCRDSAAAGVRRDGQGGVAGLGQIGGADRVWLPMLAGAACWIVVFLLLPKPMWVYVFGHELTHAVWTWIFGGSVKRIQGRRGGRPCGEHEKQFSHRAGAVFFSVLRGAAGAGFCGVDLVGAGIRPTCRGFICCSARPTLFMSR